MELEGIDDEVSNHEFFGLRNKNVERFLVWQVKFKKSIIMSYNQEGYEFKITQAFNCLNDAIALTYSSVNHFLDIPKVMNKYGVLATVALSKTKQLNLTETKLESINLLHIRKH